MSSDQGHPTRDELLVMAYVDDELAPEIRAEFESRLANEPQLTRQIVEYQKLEILARQCTPPEPADHEWARLERDGVRRGAGGLGWTLLSVGGIGLIGYAIFQIYHSEMSVTGKVLCSSLLAGFLLLLLVKLRDRLRIIPFDPYTEVRR